VSRRRHPRTRTWRQWVIFTLATPGQSMRGDEHAPPRILRARAEKTSGAAHVRKAHMLCPGACSESGPLVCEEIVT